MKKFFLTLGIICGMFFALNFEDIKAETMELSNNGDEIYTNKSASGVNQAWRWYYRTLPINYEGQTKYVRTIKVSEAGQNTCYDGYLGATNIGGGKFIYEGYLYICGTTRPIPTKAPNPELNSMAREEVGEE